MSLTEMGREELNEIDLLYAFGPKVCADEDQEEPVPDELRLALGPEMGPDDVVDIVEIVADDNDYAAILQLFDPEALIDPSSIDDQARGWIDFAMKLAIETERVI